MRVMRWSWTDLEATPAYVKRYCYDFASLQVQAEQREIQRAQRKAERQAGGMRA